MPQAEATVETHWDETRRYWRGRLLNIPASAAGLSRQRWHNVQRVLQAVLWFDIKQQGCWAGNAALMAESDLSESTLGRARRDALELGLLEVERRDNTSGYGGRLPDRLTVNLKKLAELVEPRSADQACKVREPRTPVRGVEVSCDATPLTGVRGSKTNGDEAHHVDSANSETIYEPPSKGLNRQSDYLNRQSEEANLQSDVYIKEETPKLPHNNHPPPPETPPDQTADAAWRVVEGVLFRLGLNQAAAACRDARRAGLSPAEVNALADHWRGRSQAWGEYTHAVLRRQLARATPGMPADEGWPDYAPGASTLAARRLDEQTAKRRRRERQRLHEECNARIAQLTPDQRRRLGAEAKRRRPELAKKATPGRRVFEEGVVPLLAEWGDAGLERWLSEAA